MAHTFAYKHQAEVAERQALGRKDVRLAKRYVMTHGPYSAAGSGHVRGESLPSLSDAGEPLIWGFVDGIVVARTEGSVDEMPESIWGWMIHDSRLVDVHAMPSPNKCSGQFRALSAESGTAWKSIVQED